MNCRECDYYISEEERSLAMPGGDIKKETFQEMDTSAKLDVLFDYISAIQQGAPRRVRDRDRKCAAQIAECAIRFNGVDNKIKQNRIINATVTLIGSFCGGFAAVWSAIAVKGSF